MRRQTHGTLLKLGNGAASNEVFTTIAQVSGVKPPGKTRTTRELADHDMTVHKQYLGNKLVDMPPVTGRIFYDPQNATHESLMDAVNDGESHNWQIILPDDGGTWEFSGIVTQFEPDNAASDDGVLEADFSIQPDGILFESPEAA